MFYNHVGQVSGAERLLLLILARLDRTRFPPSLVCPDDGPLRSMAEELGVPCQSVARLQARFTWRLDLLARYVFSFWRTMSELRALIKRSEAELIHANSIRAGLVATAATVRLPIPVVWNLQDLMPRHPLSMLIRLFAAVNSRAYFFAASQATAKNFRGHVFRWFRGAGNLQSSEKVEQRDSISDVRVIYNSIELEKFQFKNSQREQIRAGLEVRIDELVIGIVGQVSAWKGQLGLIKAFAEVIKQIPKAKLLIVGAPLFNRDHHYLDQLVATVEELGITSRVSFLGQRKDVGAIMQALDVLVVNSRAEPFGLVVIEGMACGTPVIGTAAGGIPEIISHGESGWLVPPKDENSLAVALIQLLSRPELRARLAKQARREVELRFSATKYLREIQYLYRDVDRVTSSFKPESIREQGLES